MKVRTYLATLNNPDVDPMGFLELWHTKGGARYVNGQLEKGVEGTTHIQYYLNFKEPVRIAKLKKFCSKSHFTPVRVDNGASGYCLKEETRLDGPWEFGTRPVKRNSKIDWERVRDLAKQGKFDDIDPQIVVTHYGNLRQIAKDHITLPTPAESVRGTWVYGVAGLGKSHWAIEQAGGLPYYAKNPNKWWDGYRGERLVILDDLDPDHSCLRHHIKRWLDRFPFIGEIKGGAITPDYDRFIITSQYTPEEIWPEDSKTVAAIRRRCKFEHFVGFGRSEP